MSDDTLLAFDPEQLHQLERRLVRAIDECRVLRASFADLLHDAAASDVLRSIRASEVALTDTWLPVVRRIVLSGVLSGGMVWSGRVSITDPFDHPVGIPRLSILTPVAIDSAHIGALVRQLAIIAADPVLSAAVVHDLTTTDSEWVAMVNDLALRRSMLLDDPDAADPAAVARLDAAIAAFAHALQQVLGGDTCPELGRLLTALDTLHPYTAALVVRSLQLDGTTLAMVVDHLLEVATPASADLLFTAVLTDDLACDTLVRLAAAHPNVLFDIADDPTLARRILLVATDPGRVDADTAGRLLVPILDHCREWPYFVEIREPGESWPVFLAELCSPWLLQLGPLEHTWHITPEHQRDLLAFLVHDGDAFTALMLRSDQIRDGVTRSLAGASGTDSRDFHEFAAWFGMFGQIVLHERVADAQQRADDWMLLLGIASVAAAALPGGAVVGVPVAVGLLALSTIPPAAVERTEDDAEFARAYALTGAAAAVALTLADDLVPDCSPPPVPDPKSPHPAIDFRERFDDWLATLPGGYDGELADRIDRLVSTLLSSACAGAAVDA